MKWILDRIDGHHKRSFLSSKDKQEMHAASAQADICTISKRRHELLEKDICRLCSKASGSACYRLLGYLVCMTVDQTLFVNLKGAGWLSSLLFFNNIWKKRKMMKLLTQKPAIGAIILFNMVIIAMLMTGATIGSKNYGDSQIKEIYRIFALLKEIL